MTTTAAATFDAIITHPGTAHRDEFMACCLLLAVNPQAVVYRENVPDDVPGRHIVLDQGGVHDEAQLRFDHHQLPRTATPTCAITLVLPFLEIEPVMAREIWQWLEFTERLDSKGPAATAEWLGVSAENLVKTQSPIEATVLRLFKQLAVVRPDNPIYSLMAEIGREKLQYLDQVLQRVAMLAAEASIHEIVVGENRLLVLGTRCIPGDAQPSLGVELWLKRLKADVDVIVSNDDRGEGLSLYRRKETANVDFSRLEGHKEITFAHKNGFIAKTRYKEVDVLELITAAMTQKAATP